MSTRTVIVGLWLVAGCGPGTGGPGDGGSTGGGTEATGGATTTTGATTGDGSGGMTGTTGDATGTPTTGGSSTGSTTEATSGGSTGGTTGGLTCADIVGSDDCALLVEFSDELTMEECSACQGAPCGAVPECTNYPCVDGGHVVVGCCADEDCAGLSMFCGMFIATNNVCVEDDDI